MTNPTKWTLQLLAGVATTAMLAASAHAQQAAPAAAGETTLGEVVVTAQKRSERLIDVPVAVAALPAQALVQQNLVTITDYSRRVPGLNVAGTAMDQISIRGLTTGGSANDLTHMALDPNVHIQEVKALTCDIRPGRRPRGPALPKFVAQGRERALKARERAPRKEPESERETV